MARSGEGRLTIGALSRATGIPVETLRTWERRYGFPEPERKPSGHRVYPIEAVPRLRRVGEALARGHRPAEVVALAEPALSDLLSSMRTDRPPGLPAAAAPPAPRDAPARVRELLDAAATFDGVTFRRRLDELWVEHGPLPFLDRICAPFLDAVGDAWSEGSLGIRHEHFASARLADFLREVRRPYEDRAEGPRAAFLTLPEDAHELGLLMAALVFALAGWRVLYLGANTPVDQAAALSRDTSLGAVAVSISSSYPGERAEAELRSLRRRLARGVPLVVGGRGNPSLRLQGLVRPDGLSAAFAWAERERSGAFRTAEPSVLRRPGARKAHTNVR